MYTSNTLLYTGLYTGTEVMILLMRVEIQFEQPTLPGNLGTVLPAGVLNLSPFARQMYVDLDMI